VLIVLACAGTARGEATGYVLVEGEGLIAVRSGYGPPQGGGGLAFEGGLSVGDRFHLGVRGRGFIVSGYCPGSTDCGNIATTSWAGSLALEARGLIPVARWLRIGLGGSLGYQRWNACFGVASGASNWDRCGDEGPYVAVDLRAFFPVGPLMLEFGFEQQVAAGLTYNFVLASGIMLGIAHSF